MQNVFAHKLDFPFHFQIPEANHKLFAVSSIPSSTKSFVNINAGNVDKRIIR